MKGQSSAVGMANGGDVRMVVSVPGGVVDDREGVHKSSQVGLAAKSILRLWVGPGVDGGRHALTCEVLRGVRTDDVAAATGWQEPRGLSGFHVKISLQTWLPQPAVHEGV